MCFVRDELSLKKQLNIDCILCEVRAQAEVTVEY